MSKDTFLEERFELVKERIRDMQQEMDVPERFMGFFKEMTPFLNYVLNFHEKIQEGWLDQASLAELQKNNQALYEGILPGAYETSYANPAYAVRMLREDYGRLLSFLAAEVRGIVAYAYEDRLFDMTVIMELYVQIYNLLEEPVVPAEEIKDTLYWYVSDYSEEMAGRRIREAVDPSLDFAVRIICDNDLTDLRYLYKYGEYVTENELAMAEYLNSFSENELQDMARTFTEGYRIGFINGRKDITKKNSVNIRYQLGFEPIVKRAVLQFEKMGLKPVIYRSAVHAVNKKQHHRIGYYGAVPNKQFDYDHKDDAALFLDQEFVQRKLRVMQVAYEQVKELAGTHGGPAVIETFGEKPFTPENKKEAFS
ncbi:MAG: leucyl aminopeptidase, partial [Blautia coccoides]